MAVMMLPRLKLSSTAFSAKVFLIGVLAFCPGWDLRANAAGQEPLKSAMPEELIDTWEQFQRAVQDWGERFRDRLATRSVREDRPTITQMLTNKEFLGLSADQVKKLEQLRDNFQRQSIRTDADLKIIEMDIVALTDSPTTEVAKVESKIREGEKLRADLRIARVRAIEQAKAVLTPEQRRKFYEKIESRQARSGGEKPSSTEKESLSR
jgi:Spy/CpxP family protein refolding chaperone